MLIDYPLTRWSLTCLKLRRLVSELLFKMNEAVYDQGCNEDVLTVTVPKLDDAAAKGGPNESDAEIRKETSPPLTDWSQTEAPFSYENPPNEDELRALLSKDEYALVDGECERIRNHSKFKEYEQWIKNEFGADNPDWIFGDLLLSDPLEDVIGFVLWIHGKLPEQQAGQAPQTTSSTRTSPQKVIDLECITPESAMELEEILTNDAKKDNSDYNLLVEIERIQQHHAFPAYKAWGVSAHELDEDHIFGRPESNHIHEIMHFVTWYSKNGKTNTPNDQGDIVMEDHQGGTLNETTANQPARTADEQIPSEVAQPTDFVASAQPSQHEDGAKPIQQQQALENTEPQPQLPQKPNEDSKDELQQQPQPAVDLKPMKQDNKQQQIQQTSPEQTAPANNGGLPSTAAEQQPRPELALELAKSAEQEPNKENKEQVTTEQTIPANNGGPPRPEAEQQPQPELAKSAEQETNKENKEQVTTEQTIPANHGGPPRPEAEQQPQPEMALELAEQEPNKENKEQATREQTTLANHGGLPSAVPMEPQHTPSRHPDPLGVPVSGNGLTSTSSSNGVYQAGIPPVPVPSTSAAAGKCAMLGAEANEHTSQNKFQAQNQSDEAKEKETRNSTTGSESEPAKNDNGETKDKGKKDKDKKDKDKNDKKDKNKHDKKDKDKDSKDHKKDKDKKEKKDKDKTYRTDDETERKESKDKKSLSEPRLDDVGARLHKKMREAVETMETASQASGTEIHTPKSGGSKGKGKSKDTSKGQGGKGKGKGRGNSKGSEGEGESGQNQHPSKPSRSRKGDSGSNAAAPPPKRCRTKESHANANVTWSKRDGQVGGPKFPQILTLVTWSVDLWGGGLSRLFPFLSLEEKI